jgi:hypothetical protein
LTDPSSEVDLSSCPPISTPLKYRVLIEHLRIVFNNSIDILQNAKEFEHLSAEAEEKKKHIEE